MSDSVLERSIAIQHEKDATASAVPWRRWLFAFDCYNASTNLLFTSAIWVIYLAAHGYSPLAIGLFEMVYHIAKFVAEVPTGIFADMVGRRKSLILYCLVNAANNLLFLVPTVPFIALGFVLSGTSQAFRGGAGEAILWNIAGHADASNQSRRYSKLVSRMFLIGLVGEIVGTAMGGYLGHVLEVLPFICQAGFGLLGIVPLLFVPEQRIAPAQRTRALRHLRKGLQAVWHTPTLLGLLLISGLTDGCWMTVYFFYQLYLHGLGFSLSLIGLIVAASTATSFLFTAAAPFLMRMLRERWLVPIFVGMEALGLLLMSLPQPVLALVGYLVFFQGSVAVLYPAVSTYINERSPEEQRATVLSMQTGLFSAAMIVLFPLFGLGVSHVAYSTAFLWTLGALAGGALVILGLTWLLERPLNRSRSDMPGEC